ncbi:NAD(P)/FAD-dependent oxidoreductase [Nitratireductor sp. XY-223]|uniref:NAD(P)/FAD-dependent oxidoreductase n=1 Tax=Nitratireductor sp. XY-223 TaxID=2561926 RepID=UPI0010AAF7D1|nr:NAD(P)/FAD-dependent oxidoreductase [Nitratireductor sp. XY-223]
MTDYQVAIIGGGPAGLTAALTLSRSMMRTIVFDSPIPARNAASPHVGAYPTMDMATPDEVRESIAANIRTYGYADLKSAEIAEVHEEEDGFVLSTQGGSSFRARRLLMTTGMVDKYPSIEDLKDYWGTSIINCPFCQGYEVRNQSWGVYVHRPEILAAAEIYRNWTDDLVMFVEPGIDVPPERAEAIEALGIRLIPGRIEAVEGSGEKLTHVVLRSGRRVPRDILLVWPHQTQSELVKSLDLPLSDDGYVKIDECYRTGRRGIFAAGDLTYGGHQNTNTAIHMGNMAAAWLVFDLCQSRAREEIYPEDRIVAAQ